MDEWADVLLSPSPDRAKLERLALFIIPSVYDRCTRNGLSKAYLESFGTTNPNTTVGVTYAGKNAIGKVWNGDPVKYDSARGFIHLANAALIAGGKNDQLGLDDIVACVFRLKDAPEVAAALSMTPYQIAGACRLNVDVVAGALKKYRLPFCDADTIWRTLLAEKAKLAEPIPDALQYLNSDVVEFVKTDVRNDLPMAIYRTGDNAYVYRGSNVSPAPRAGHPWALDRSGPSPRSSS